MGAGGAKAVVAPIEIIKVVIFISVVIANSSV